MITLSAFPFLRTCLQCVSKLLKLTVVKVPCITVYITELPKEQAVISITNVITLKGKRRGTVIQLQGAIRSLKWHHAWLKLDPLDYGWFAIAVVYWKNGNNTHWLLFNHV